MSPQMKAALILMAITGVLLMVWLCWWYVKKQRPFEEFAETHLSGWPKRNPGGGYDWPDGSVTRDPEGRDVIRQR